MLGVVLLLCVVISLGLALYFKLTRGHCTSKRDLSGKTAIVTGANSGIGFCTALDFAGRNARVILACRNRERAQRACDEIKKESGNDNVIVRVVDLSSMKSVRKFAEETNRTERRLDILVNNAGVIGLPKTMTEDGLEAMFAANHFGPFLLTNLLLDLMKKTGQARIVTVSSLVNSYGNIDFDNLRAEKSYNRYKVYNDTKLANVLFTKELARRLKGTDVTANCLHPGTVRSGLLRELPTVVLLPIKLVGLLFFKSAEEGAQTSIHCAVSEETEGVSGQYFSDCCIVKTGLASIVHDEAVAQRLWEISEKYTGL